MVQTLKNHKLFFILYVVLFSGLLIVLFSIDKGDSIVFFSDNRTESMNYFFRFMSFLVEPWTFVLIAAICFFWDYRNSLLIGLAGTMTLFISHYLKIFFSHSRPKLYLSKQGIWEGLVPVANYESLTGLTSFPSGHAMAAFALFSALLFIVKDKRVGVLFLFLAVFSALSRIYLMNHFLQDVLAGSMAGIALSLTLKWIIDKLDLPHFVPFARFSKREA